MRRYIPRRIDFQSTESVDGWMVKIYTITFNASFQSDDVLKKALKKLPEWLKESKSMGFPVHGMAFLIVHEASDGVWSLLSWWAGGEMLRTITWYTDLRTEKGFACCLSRVLWHVSGSWRSLPMKERPGSPIFLKKQNRQSLATI